MKKCLFTYLFFLFSIVIGVAGTVKKTDRLEKGLAQLTITSSLSTINPDKAGDDKTQGLVYSSGHTVYSISVQQFYLPANGELFLAAHQVNADNPSDFKEMRQREYLCHLFPSHFFW